MNDLVRFALTAFFPRVGELPGLAELDIDRKVAKLRREATWLVWFGIVVAALIFQFTPILTVRRLRPRRSSRSRSSTSTRIASPRTLSTCSAS